MRLCVAYLVRDPAAARRFLAVYASHDPGADHTLLLVGRGRAGLNLAADLSDKTPGSRWCGVVGPWHRSLSAFRQAADTWDCFDAFAFLNSHSRPQRGDWLRKLSRLLKDTSCVGAVSATGSWESYRTNRPRPWNAVVPEFPNPALRTNAIALRRADALAWLPRFSLLRELEYLRESGPRSLTRRCWASGRMAMVASEVGALPWESWRQAMAFRVAGQEALLVADNQTDEYERADWERQGELRRRTWGA